MNSFKDVVGHRNIIKYIEKKQVKEEETINPAIQELMAFFRKQNG